MSSETTLRAELFGRDVRFDYSETWVGYSLVVLRVLMGWTLFQGGLTKVLTYLDADPSNDWTAAGFLTAGIPDGNPLTGVWAAMAGNPLIDLLNMWGLTLTGLGLIVGVLVRFNAFWGAMMMLFYWAASLTGGPLQGLPIAHGWWSTTTWCTRSCCSASARSAPGASSGSTSTSRTPTSCGTTPGSGTSSAEAGDRCARVLNTPDASTLTGVW